MSAIVAYLFIPDTVSRQSAFLPISAIPLPPKPRHSRVFIPLPPQSQQRSHPRRPVLPFVSTDHILRASILTTACPRAFAKAGRTIGGRHHLLPKHVVGDNACPDKQAQNCSHANDGAIHGDRSRSATMVSLVAHAGSSGARSAKDVRSCPCLQLCALVDSRISQGIAIWSSSSLQKKWRSTGLRSGAD